MSEASHRPSTQPLTQHEAGLAKLIANAWSGSFPISYDMPNPKGIAKSWVRWQLDNGRSASEWTCDNLQHASSLYAWDDQTKIHNPIHYDNCRKMLLGALWDKQDGAATKEACFNIFKWGGVARDPKNASRVWLETLHVKGELVARLQEVIAVLKSETDPSSDFGRDTILMNSSLTKVYAMGDPEGDLPIFDGRVGSALGILTIAYCRSEGLTKVPAELSFGYFENQNPKRKGSRDPSRDSFRFRALGIDKFHAACMWRSFRVLKAAQQLIGNNVSMLSIERGLFMVGYDVSRFK